VGGAFVCPVILVQSPIVEMVLRDFIMQDLQSRIGEEVWIGGLQLQPLRRRIVVDGLIITGPDPQKPVASIAEVIVELQYKEDRPLVKSITVHNPRLRLALDEKGLTSFQNIRKTGKPPAELFPWENLDIRQLSVQIVAPAYNIRANSIDIHHEGKTAKMDLDSLDVVLANRDLHFEPFSMDDIHWTPKRIGIPSLAMVSNDVSVSGSVNLVESRHFQSDIHATGDLSWAYSTEKARLNGAFNLNAIASGELPKLDISGTVDLADATFELFGSTSEWVSYPIGTPAGSWSLDGAHVDFEDVYMPWASGEIQLAGRVGIKDKTLVLDAEGEGLHLLEAEDLAHLPTYTDGILNFKSQLSGSFSPFDITGPIDLEFVDLDIAGGDIRLPENAVMVSLDTLTSRGEIGLTTTRVVLAADEFRTLRNSGDFDLVLDLSPEKWMKLDYVFSKADLSEFRPLAGANLTGRGTMLGKVEGNLDDLGLVADVDLRGFSAAGYPFADEVRSRIIGTENLKRFRFENLNMKRGETVFTGPMEMWLSDSIGIDANLQTKAGRAKDLAGIFFSLDGIDAQVDGGARIQGSLTDLDVVASLELREVSVFKEVFEQGRLLMRFRDDSLTLEGLSVHRNNGSENILVRGNIPPNGDSLFEILATNISIDDLQLVDSTGVPIHGRLGMGALLSGPDLLPSGKIHLYDLSCNGNAIEDGYVMFNTDESKNVSYSGEIASGSLTLRGASGLSSTDPYRFLWKVSDFPMHLLYPETVNGSPIESLVTGQVTMAGGGEKPFGVKAMVNQFFTSWDDVTLKTIKPWTVVLSDDDLSIDGFRMVDDAQSNFTVKGRRTVDGNLDFNARGILDMHLLEGVIPGLNRSSGALRLRSSLRGSLESPIIQINLNMQEGYLSGDWFPHPLEEMQGKIFITPARITFDDLEGRLGGGDVDIQGFVASNDFIPERVDVHTTLRDGQLRLIDDFPPIRNDSRVHITGPLEQLLISGEVNILELLYTDRIDWEDALLAFSSDLLADAVAEEEESAFSFDIQVLANETIRVRNNLADLTASAGLQFIGSLSRPGMQGWVRAQPQGRVLLKEREFELQRGEMRFVEPYSFEPEVDVAMITTVHSVDQDYDIQYNITGGLYDWTAKTYSDPPLPQADINALLVFGMTREELELQGAGSALMVEGSDLLVSKIGVVQSFKEVGEGIFQTDLLQFDRVDLVSGASARGTGAFSSALRLAVEKDIGPNTTVSYEQNLTQANDVYVSLEQQLAKKFYLRGFFAREPEGRYLDNFLGAYGLEFQLRWELD
jgi:hypothetical protein